MFKIAACYSIMNEEDYIKYSIDSIYDYVDKVIIVFGLPWTGIVVKRDRTRDILKEYDDRGNKFIIQETDCRSQAEQLSRCLKVARDLGMDYFWLIDGDEIYEKKGIKAIQKRLSEDLQTDCFSSLKYTYWRSVYYVIDPPEGSAPIIMRITPDLIFKGRRIPSGIKSNFVFPVSENMFHHFSYAKSPTKIKEKISTFGHSHEILPNWFEEVFLKWEENKGMIDLHPVWKSHYRRAIRVGLDRLPDVMKLHPFTKVEVIK